MDRTAYNALLAQYRVRELTGDGAVNWDSGVHCVIPEVKLLGKCGQDGTPTPETPVEIKCNNGTFAVNGQNIFDANTFTQELLSIEGSSQATIDGRNCVRFYNWGAHRYGAFIPFHGKKNTQYTIQLSVKADGIPTDGSGALDAHIYYEDGTDLYMFSLRAQNAQDWTTFTRTTDASKTISYLTLSYGTAWYWYIDVGSISMVEGSYIADTMPPYAPYFDGGTAQAPDLMAAVDGSCQSAYDPQTGALTDWWWPEITLNGSEAWAAYTSGSWIGFRVINALPETMLRNAYWCNMFAPLKKGETASPPHLWCGVGNNILFAVAFSSVGFPYYDDTLEDKGLANWKAHLAEQPLRVRVARNEPLLTYETPTRLIMPSGYGQIIQTGGDVADCPLAVRWLGHQ